MSKRKSAASSANAAAASFQFGAPAFGASVASSSLSHIAEPPDFSRISEPAVVVTFKNLTKRDALTKERALQELQTVVGATEEGSLEDGIISAWVDLYPRLSIENARQVRLLSHQVLGLVAQKSKKRFLPRMPRVVGCWLAGLYDGDKLVSQAAANSMRAAFQSEEKVALLWKAYQGAILEFCSSAVLNETPGTLSDERNNSPDDMEAKYVRVVSGGLMAISHLISALKEETHKHDDSYSEFLNDKRTWTFASSKHSQLRQPLYGLLRAVLVNRKDLIEPSLPTISTAAITKASAESQVGSNSDYLITLIYITKAFPQCWELAATKKASSLSLLRRYIRRGAQGATQVYWQKLTELLQLLPDSALPQELKQAEDLLKAIVEGVTSAFGEHRANNAAAWNFFFVSCRYLMSKLQIEGLQNEILDEWIAKVLDANLGDDAGKESKFQILGDTVVILADGIEIITMSDDNNFRTEFEGLWKSLSGGISTKLIPQSQEQDGDTPAEPQKRPTESHKHLLARIEKWIGLTSILYGKFDQSSWQAAMVQDSEVDLLERAVAVAAQSDDEMAGLIVSTLLYMSKSAAALKQHDRSRDIMKAYVGNTVPLILSKEWNEAAMGTLISYGMQWDDKATFAEAWTKTMRNMVEKDDREHLVSILKAGSVQGLRGVAPDIPELETYVTEKSDDARKDNSELTWNFLGAALDASGFVISIEFGMETLSRLISAVGTPTDVETLQYAQRVCQLLLDLSTSTLLGFSKGEENAATTMTQQLPKLLALMELPQEEVSTVAETAYKKVQQVINASHSGGPGLLLDALKCSVLKKTGDAWLSIESLASGAQDLLEETDQNQIADSVEKILFSAEEWENALLPLYSESPKASSAYLQLLGACACLVEVDSNAHPAFELDDEGLPLAVRMGIFTTKLLEALEPTLRSKDDDDENEVSYEFGKMQLGEANSRLLNMSEAAKETLLKPLLLLGEISKDLLLFRRSIRAEVDITPRWDLVESLASSITDSLLYILSYCSNWDAAFLPEREAGEPQGETFLSSTLYSFVSQLEPGRRDSERFYVSRALARLLESLRLVTDGTGENGQAWIEKNKMRRSKNVLLNVSLLAGYGGNVFKSTPGAIKLRNELINDVSGVSTKTAPTDGLEKLILLNELWHSESEETHLDIPEQRLILFVRQLLGWFQNPETEFAAENPNLLCEAARSLYRVVIAMRMVHGSHWQGIFKFLSNGFQVAEKNREIGNFISISLFKLVEIIKEAKAINAEYGDVNDDLNDELDESLPVLYATWLDMLKASRESDRDNPPLRARNSALARNLSKVPLKFINDAEDCYELLTVESTAIQGATFNILHIYIPTQQEQISIDAALSKEEDLVIQLPPEALSLILEVPKPTSNTGRHYLTPSYLDLRRYLSSWLLVYDHFKESSFKVKAAYVDNLKEGGYVKALLDFIFDQLGHSRGKPIDGSNYEINDYRLEIEVDSDSEKRDSEELMVHLYYLSLRFTPSLAKAWFNECRNRQTIQNVETFTERYISPLLVEAELDAVNKWLEDPNNSPEGLNVTVNRTVREVKTTYDVDEQQMEMLVKLPTSFPLKQVEVKGIRRVAVSESQWRNWLLACQAVIALQSGSIVDGLMLFQRNVKLHLDGVEECAICYSILSTVERTLPTKGCGTCKRKFHGSCLMRWFKTSSSSSCPLCRSSFQFV